ncbi:hypothetical protein TEQG_03449 [Trichophyton equinum CBS 127.97]|uniref:Uncharacterized protein n=1 Tax=Trichophyton equinum (strain ATCC MYA-4606 / CBS 127.97) TaxID=559882 RepID=F2PRR0_TRIEC|nr:hypothetical protein TEQG_03449 [Trichophyton equinum CBS 127.97]
MKSTFFLALAALVISVSARCDGAPDPTWRHSGSCPGLGSGSENVIRDARKKALAVAVAEALRTEIAGVATMIVTASLEKWNTNLRPMRPMIWPTEPVISCGHACQWAGMKRKG